MTPERIKELRAFINKPGLSGTEGVYIAQVETSDCLDTIEAQAARIVELEAALKPFADDELHEGLDEGPDDQRTTWPSFRLGDFRTARAALTKGE